MKSPHEPQIWPDLVISLWPPGADLPAYSLWDIFKYLRQAGLVNVTDEDAGLLDRGVCLLPHVSVGHARAVISMAVLSTLAPMRFEISQSLNEAYDPDCIAAAMAVAFRDTE